MFSGELFDMAFFDISIPLDPSTPVWQGDSSILFERDYSIPEGDVFNVSTVRMGVHCGTHIDAPFHMVQTGMTADQIPLDVLIGKVQVVEIPDDVRLITSDVLKAAVIDPQIPRILFKTHNSQLRLKDPLRFFTEFVALDSSAAEYLVSNGVRLAGIDYFSISPFDDLIDPHMILLKAGVTILENINLTHVPPGSYRLVCLPLKLVGTDGAPARAILEPL